MVSFPRFLCLILLAVLVIPVLPAPAPACGGGLGIIGGGGLRAGLFARFRERRAGAGMNVYGGGAMMATGYGMSSMYSSRTVVRTVAAVPIQVQMLPPVLTRQRVIVTERTVPAPVMIAPAPHEVLVAPPPTVQFAPRARQSGGGCGSLI